MDAKEAKKLAYEYRNRLNFSKEVLNELRKTLNIRITKLASIGEDSIRLVIGDIIHETIRSSAYNNLDIKELTGMNANEKNNYEQKLIDDLQIDGYDVKQTSIGTFIRW